jgi:sterol desaturase/sphingolipid hydroxylase (fatty acid hydroxylase superfamily)
MWDRITNFAGSKAGLVLAFLLVFFVLERLFPKVRPLLRAHLNSLIDQARRIGRNLALAGFNATLSPLVVLPLTALAASHALTWRPDWWSGWPGLVVDLVLLDGWIYWWHRANHEVCFLWRFHEVHHLDVFLDTTSALRFHAGEVVLSALVRVVVIFVLAVPFAHVVVFETLIVLAAIFHHSNVNLPERFERALSFLIVTPSIHWVHHHAVRADTDSNYSTVLSVWDRLFASRSPTRRFADMPIGVEGREDESLRGLAVRPFWARRR